MVLLTKTEAAGGPMIRSKLAWCISLGTLCITMAIVFLTTDLIFLITYYRMQASPGSIVEDFMTKPMYPVIVSTWLFNITNAERFQTGQDHKLKVQQVGPFTYKETRYNDNFELDMTAGEMRFDSRSVVEFVPEQSGMHADLATVTLPNLAMLGVASMMSNQGSLPRMGYNMLVSRLGSTPTVTVNASAYLWGYKDPLLTLAHSLLPGYINFEKMGILDRFFNGSNHMEISARNEDKFMVKKCNGLTRLPMGNLKSLEECELCDDFSNTYEALGFPSPITPETPIRVFKNGLCKILTTVYDKTVVNDNGVKGLVFNLSDSFFSLDPNDTNTRMLDLRDCFYGIPVAVSKAYFLDVDPKLYERIEGIPEPDPSKQSYFIIEPLVALELETIVRVQLNLVLPDLSFNSRTSRYSHMVVPVAYLEFVQPPLPEQTQQALYQMYVFFPNFIKVCVLLLILAGMAFFSYPIVLFFAYKRLKTEKSAVKSTQEPLLQSKIQDGYKNSDSSFIKMQFNQI